MDPLLELLSGFLVVGMSIVTLLGAFFIGSWQEKRHFQRLEQAEDELSGILVTDLKHFPQNWQADGASLVCGEVVIANDKFKTWIAGWINLTGGRVFSYETLLERARREAIVRMMRDAQALDANAVWNVRILTSVIGGGVEAVAFGTALNAKIAEKRTS